MTRCRISDGLSLFEDDQERTRIGFLGSDPTDPSARFKGNNLFYISIYDHMYQRVYVHNIPMCACVEQIPVVTRSDCTQIDIQNEQMDFLYSSDKGLVATIVSLNIEFNACQGADEQGNDLVAYYEQPINDGKATRAEKDVFDKVGETYCGEAIHEFLDGSGLVAKPVCVCFEQGLDYCGCDTVDQVKIVVQLPEPRVARSGRDGIFKDNHPNVNLIENYFRNPGGSWPKNTKSTKAKHS